MRSKRKNVRNVKRYLNGIGDDEEFLIVVPLVDGDVVKMQKYGLIEQTPITYITPRPLGVYTDRNANGRWLVLKDLPKEPRTYEVYYHIIDWHGNDHYGTCFHTRDCYQRVLQPPLEVAFCVDRQLVYSAKFINRIDELERIKLAMDMALEIFGRFEITKSIEAYDIKKAEIMSIPWEILRPGTTGEVKIDDYLESTTRTLTPEQRKIIVGRHELIQGLQPDFHAIGLQGFWGYVVYGFSKKNLFIFECNRPDNATYIFEGDWENASKLTKMEVLTGEICKLRIYHTETWRINLERQLE